jgi:hypothetical protein
MLSDNFSYDENKEFKKIDEVNCKIFDQGICYLKCLEYFFDEKVTFKNSYTFDDTEKFIDRNFAKNTKINVTWDESIDDKGLLKIGKFFMRL